MLEAGNAESDLPFGKLKILPNKYLGTRPGEAGLLLVS